MINLCIPTLNSFNTLEEAIHAALAGSLVPDRILVIDNSGGMCPIKSDDKVTVYTPDHNLGVAASWNYFMKMYPQDTNIIINDDIIVRQDSIKNFIDGLSTVEHDGLYYAMKGANSFSFFYIPFHIYNEVGAFDEEFYPAYFEDNDYHYRLKLAGYDIYSLPDVTVFHVGSSTARNYTPEQQERHHKAFRRNREYYISKWGGEPGHEDHS